MGIIDGDGGIVDTGNHHLIRWRRRRKDGKTDCLRWIAFFIHMQFFHGRKSLQFQMLEQH